MIWRGWVKSPVRVHPPQGKCENLPPYNSESENMNKDISYQVQDIPAIIQNHTELLPMHAKKTLTPLSSHATELLDTMDVSVVILEKKK